MISALPWHRHLFILVIVLVLPACSGGGGGGGGGVAVPAPPASSGPDVIEDDLADVTAYRPESNHGAVLATCATATTDAAACTLGTLPLLGSEVAAPTIDDIMDRVAVSHTWMAERFQQALEVLPPQILSLFRAVTAVVIDNNIRPSYYTTRTAAIYLDPANLWLTNAEKATIDVTPDYRSDFASELAFRSLWRYVQDGAYAYRSYSLTGTETRTVAEIRLRLASLLFHELAHANDFVPPATLNTLDPGTTPSQAIAGLGAQRISNQLAAQFPLQSDVMYGLAAVMFQGETATAEQKALNATEVGNEFEPDDASDDYAYSSIYEDVAMLFEEAMMKFHFDVDRQMAFTSAPDSNSCVDYIVGWGVHGRIGDGDVRTRAQFVHDEILPGDDLSLFFQDLVFPAAMTPDDSWCVIPNPGTQMAISNGVARPVSALPIDGDQLLRHY